MSRIKRVFTDISNHLEPLRKWLDGEDAPDPATKMREAGRTSSRSEAFMLTAAREIDRVLREEFVANRIKGTAYVPAKFSVFLSASDDNAWGGEKRRFLQQTLADIIFQEASKLCGEKLKLGLSAITVEIRVDGTLAGEELYVRPVADVSTDVTVFNPAGSKSGSRNAADGDTVFDPSGGRRGAKPLYFLEIFENGKRQQRMAVYNAEVTIGRGSDTNSVDIKLPGEPRISRVHAALKLDEKGQLWVTARGTNPILIAGRLLARGEAAKIQPNEGIEIYDFTLHYKSRPPRKRKVRVKNT